MSEVETALTGAEVAPVENTASTPGQSQASTDSTTEQVETQEQQEQRARDEKGRFVPQERVNEITRARREAERRAEALERELSQYRQQPVQHQPQSTEAPPSLEDFGYDMTKWSSAMSEYAIKQAESRVEQRFQQYNQRQHQQTVEQQFQARSQEYAKAHPDFDQAVDQLASSVSFHPAIVDAIGNSEHGPAVVHYLAQHLDEADALSRLPPHLAAVRLGRLEAQVSTAKPKPVTNAPNPPPTLSGGKAVVRRDINDPDLPQAEWLALRNSQLKR